MATSVEQSSAPAGDGARRPKRVFANVDLARAMSMYGTTAESLLSESAAESQPTVAADSQSPAQPSTEAIAPPPEVPRELTREEKLAKLRRQTRLLSNARRRDTNSVNGIGLGRTPTSAPNPTPIPAAGDAVASGGPTPAELKRLQKKEQKKIAAQARKAAMHGSTGALLERFMTPDMAKSTRHMVDNMGTRATPERLISSLCAQ